MPRWEGKPDEIKSHYLSQKSRWGHLHATMGGDADVGTYDEDDADEPKTDDEVEEVDAE